MIVDLKSLSGAKISVIASKIVSWTCSSGGVVYLQTDTQEFALQDTSEQVRDKVEIAMGWWKQKLTDQTSKEQENDL